MCREIMLQCHHQNIGKSMSLKKITSLTMMLTMIMMTYTGIILFITPPGRIAHWAQWKLLGMTKEQFASVHSTFMVLFILATILHVYYNWKPLTSYMKNQAKQMIVFTKEMVVAVLLTAVFLMGALYEFSPFSNFLNFGSEVKESWEKEYGTPPYSHAELSSLDEFLRKLDYDRVQSETILQHNSIAYTLKQSMEDIAKENGTSPQKIHALLRGKLGKKGTSQNKQLSGLGKKSIKSVAEAMGMTTEELIVKLRDLGIQAKEDDKFKVIVEEHDQSPSDVVKALGFRHE